ncbi:hypothetical protein ACFQ60_46835 [Streptomyces zhihengii]
MDLTPQSILGNALTGPDFETGDDSFHRFRLMQAELDITGHEGLQSSEVCFLTGYYSLHHW